MIKKVKLGSPTAAPAQNFRFRRENSLTIRVLMVPNGVLDTETYIERWPLLEM
jgi:hypothetical protein